MVLKKIVTFVGAAVLAIGLASAPALARGGGGHGGGGGFHGGGGGFHGGGFHGGGFHGGGFHGGGFHGGGFRGGGFHGGFAHRGFGHGRFFAGGLGYGFYDPYYAAWPYDYDGYAYDDCYSHLVRVHGHWVRRTYCG